MEHLIVLAITFGGGFALAGITKLSAKFKNKPVYQVMANWKPDGYTSIPISVITEIGSKSPELRMWLKSLLQSHSDYGVYPVEGKSEDIHLRYGWMSLRLGINGGRCTHLYTNHKTYNVNKDTWNELIKYEDSFKLIDMHLGISEACKGS